MDNQGYYAHIRNDKIGKKVYQTVEEHCKNTAVYTSEKIKDVGLKNIGYLAGLLHDMGKYTRIFQKYLIDATEGKPVKRGSVNHTFASVKYILEELKVTEEIEEAYIVMTQDILAYASGAHHGQFDCIDENGNSGFGHRKEKTGIGYEEAVENYFYNCVHRKEIDKYFTYACKEIIEVYQKELELIKESSNQDHARDEISFYIGATARLLQSSLIDADRQDTSEFMQNIKYIIDKNDLIEIWKKELQYAENKIKDFNNNSRINQSRNWISDQCKLCAIEAPGLFRLNVPTGAGKTLSSLRFALTHAIKWKKKKIIFTSPLLSILEQNAQVIHEFIENQDIILEHHSNVVQPIEDADELNLNELMVENWNAPIIITTLVQMLNTMFDGATSSIRRFHALCNAVIVIDEVQSVPNHLLTMFNLMVSFLCQICGSTIVLCSATQPYLHGAEYPVHVKSRDMVPYNKSIWSTFHRTDIINGGNCRFDELEKKIKELLGEAHSLLIICNKKNESERLYRYLSGEYTCYHLSASMCMEHRKSVLEEIKQAIKKEREKPILCISTQVIEAGVDISFECVIRLLAGMDSVVQAAGRCNRNGEREKPAPVYILNCTDENLAKLADINRAKAASVELLYEYSKAPECFNNDLTSEKAIEKYYKFLYTSMPLHYQDEPIKGKNYTVFSLLAYNQELLTCSEVVDHYMNQAFRLAKRNFKIFDNDTLDVIVPYGKGKEIISNLCSIDNVFEAKYLIKQARGYIVTLYPYQKRYLDNIGAIIPISFFNHQDKCGMDIWMLRSEYYDLNTGVTIDGQESEYLEV